MKYAVIGAAGQLGRDLCPMLKGEVVPLSRQEADLTRADLLETTLRDMRPDVVINCAAYNFVDRAETEPENAFATNAWGVRSLARICRELGCLVVHFSTDYVFGLDESRHIPYTEADGPGPVSVYGLSKLAGEYLLRSTAPQHILIRTCGLYGVWGSGGKGGNFVETMLRLGNQGKPLRVVSDQFCTPSYTKDVAASATALIATGTPGLYHLTNSGCCSWHQFASKIFQLAGMKMDLTPISSAEYGAPARRPPYSVLAMNALARAGVQVPRSWDSAVEDYLRERHKRT